MKVYAVWIDNGPGIRVLPAGMFGTRDQAERYAANCGRCIVSEYEVYDEEKDVPAPPPPMESWEAAALLARVEKIEDGLKRHWISIKAQYERLDEYGHVHASMEKGDAVRLEAVNARLASPEKNVADHEQAIGKLGEAGKLFLESQDILRGHEESHYHRLNKHAFRLDELTLRLQEVVTRLYPTGMTDSELSKMLESKRHDDDGAEPD